MISKRTQIRVLVDGTPDGNGWSAKKIPIEGEEDKKANRISLQIESPSNAIIGKYIVSLDDPKNRLYLFLSFHSYYSKYVQLTQMIRIP